MGVLVNLRFHDVSSRMPVLLFAIDLRPDYDDTAPLPAPGQAAVWKYRAIYRLNDAQVGSGAMRYR
jgi:hypothetical protein